MDQLLNLLQEITGRDRGYCQRAVDVFLNDNALTIAGFMTTSVGVIALRSNPELERILSRRQILTGTPIMAADSNQYSLRISLPYDICQTADGEWVFWNDLPNTNDIQNPNEVIKYRMLFEDDHGWGRNSGWRICDGEMVMSCWVEWYDHDLQYHLSGPDDPIDPLYYRAFYDKH